MPDVEGILRPRPARADEADVPGPVVISEVDAELMGCFARQVGVPPDVARPGGA
jgi:hypothetical protein